jgi:hypothetical protein
MKIKINEPIFEKKEDRIEKGRTKEEVDETQTGITNR